MTKQTDSDEISNILPSYYMDQSTISKSLYSLDYSNLELPNYLPSTDANSESASQTPSSRLSSPTPRNQPTFTDFSDPTTTFTHWDDSILANVDKLKVLHKYSNNISKDLKIKIFLTKDVGRRGIEPEIITPSSVLLQQGQYIYGFLTIVNEGERALPFDMLFVTFEGVVALDEDKCPFIHKFLNMFDFHASWSDANLHIFNDDYDYNAINPVIDPYDNSRIWLPIDKLIIPNITYKKFFVFKLPEKLLDNGCDLIKHLQITPSIGKSLSETLTESKHKDAFNKDASRKDVIIKRTPNPPDFFFNGSSISYRVCARIIGRSKDYEFFSNDDKLVIVGQAYQYIKVESCEHPLFQVNRNMMLEEAILIHQNRVHKIEEFIQQYARLPKTISLEELNAVKSETHELNKLKNYYYEAFDKPRKHTYEVFLTYTVKKSVLSKVKGLVTLSTDKKVYLANIDPHIKIRDLKSSPKSEITIPLTLSYVSKNLNLEPHINAIHVDLMILDIKSKQRPIPCVFHPDMIFENSSKPNDDFEHLTIKKFQSYARELNKIFKDSKDSRNIIDYSLINDIKCLSNLRSSTTKLHIHSPLYPSLNKIGWEKQTTSGKNDKYTKTFDLKVDLVNATSNVGDFRIVPDFQNCYMSRMYYLQIKVRINSSHVLLLKIPIIIQCPPKQET